MDNAPAEHQGNLDQTYRFHLRMDIADYNPRLYVTGPLLPGKLNFSESFGYDMDKQPVRGLAWPHNEIKQSDLNSFTSFQVIVSPHHLLTTNAQVFPLRRQFANINSLVPQTASSDYGQRGFSLGATDRYVSDAGILTTLVQGTSIDSYAHGQGPDAMLVTPNGWSGHFFNAYERSSHEEEFLQTFAFPKRKWHGDHNVTVGANFFHRSYRGTSVSHPVLILRADGTMAERIEFAGPGSLAARDVEAALFAQDHWELSNRLSLDAGLRYSGQTLGSWTDWGPRLGIVYSPGKSGKTILRAGFGIFYDLVPLLAGDFSANQTRVVTSFDEQGNPAGPPVGYTNVYGRSSPQGTVVTTPDGPHGSPYNVTWSAQAEHEVRPNLFSLRPGASGNGPRCILRSREKQRS